MSRRRKPVQLELRERTWGGKREGAGRPKTGKKYVPHRVRSKHEEDHPVHVTLRSRVSELRDFPVFDAVEMALARGSKDFFRVCEYSVQRNHIHLIVEADDTVSLSRGLQGLVARLAKAINRAMRRKGSVFADTPSPLPAATAWLLNVGWRRRGLLETSDSPHAQFLFD